MEKYRYNDRTARQEKVNHVLFWGISLFFVVMAVYFWRYSVEAGRDMWTVWANTAVLTAFLLLNAMVYYSKRSTGALRNLVAGEVLALYVFYSLATPASFLGMALMGIMGISIAYFDTRYFNVLFVLCTLLYIVFQILRSSTGVTQANINGFCQVMMNLAIFVLLQRMASITTVFNDHSMGAIMDQKAIQDQMVSEILDISQIVKRESDRSYDMMSRLLDSANQTAVNAQAISKTSDVIAEDLEEQTRMTREIQNAISSTQTHAHAMVTVAADSNGQISKNCEMMTQLRAHADRISATNQQVTGAMERLEEQTRAMANFVDIILNVSSQTNLLALNAAVESARAGAAGKGFSVIAEQIRTLADETRRSAEQITAIVDELGRDEQEVVDLVAASVEASEKQHTMIQQTADMVEILGRNLQQLISNIGQIDSEIENLSLANDVMVSSISKITASTEEVSASTNETRDMTSENLTYARTTNAAIGKIQQATARLEQYI